MNETTEIQVLRPKQLLLNFFEQYERQYYEAHFYEQNGFVNMELLFATEFVLDDLTNSRPPYIHHHINNRTMRHEFFIDNNLVIDKVIVSDDKLFHEIIVVHSFENGVSVAISGKNIIAETDYELLRQPGFNDYFEKVEHQEALNNLRKKAISALEEKCKQYFRNNG